jgi:hypothetical protein
MHKATNLRDIKLSLDPRPLTPPELPAFFVDTAVARDPSSNRRIEIAEELETDDHVKVLLAGHSGCGKSTELTKFCSDQSDRFFAVPFSIRSEATLSNVSIEQLLVLIVERVLSRADSFAERLSPETLESVYKWFDETFTKREATRESKIEAGGKAGAEESLLSKLLGIGVWLKADMRAGAKVLHSTVSKESRRLSELCHQCGLILKEVSLALHPRQLLLVIEDIDKASIADAERLFFDEPGPLADLPCKAIYTIPIFLQCSPRVQNLDPRFRLHTLPMIKIQNQDGTPSDTGIAAMKEILKRRMKLELIEADALKLAIDKTGGVPRDLFDVMISAASVARQAHDAQQRPREVITATDVRYGLNRRKSFILRGISVAGLPEAYKDITVEQLYERLKQYGSNPVPNAVSDPINLALMQAHALIEYNGERWYRVHPLVLEHVESL